MRTMQKLHSILKTSIDPDKKQPAQDELKAHQVKADNGYKSQLNDLEWAKQSWQRKHGEVSDQIPVVLHWSTFSG